MKLTLKNIVRIVLIIPTTLFILYCLYIVIKKEENPTFKDCGIVKSKSYDEVAIKHGSRTQLYLNIQFEKSGFRSIECEPTTYFSKNVGDYVCFELEDKSADSYRVYYVIGLVFLFIIGFACLCLIILYII